MAEYEAGDWLGLVTGSGVALVSGVPADADLGALWSGFSERGIGGLVDALAAATGTTASSLPEFAAAVREAAGTRVAVRGAVSLEEANGAGAPRVSGIGVTGWAEALWEDAADIVVSAVAAGPDAPADTAAPDTAAPDTAVPDTAVPDTAVRTLWLAAGVVLASKVWWHVADTKDQLVVATRASAPASQVPTGTTSPTPPTPKPEPEPTQEPTPEPKVAPQPQPQPQPQPEPEPAASAAAPQGADDADAEHADAEHDDEELGETLAPLRDQTYAVESDDVSVLDSTFGVLWGSTVAVSDLAARDEAAGGEPAGDARQLITGMPETLAASAEPSTQAAAAQGPVLGDHDGATISVAALRELAASSAAVPTFSTPAELAQERFGRAVVSTGAVVTLDRNVIVGRTPRATRITGDMPHLVTVPSPEQDISRSHLEIRVEGSAVVAVDLNTTNGSVLIRQGSDPVRLHPGEPAVLISGDIIDIGDGVTITCEDLP